MKKLPGWPCLMSEPMVLAVLEGLKTETRRLARSEVSVKMPPRSTCNTKPVRCKPDDPMAFKEMRPTTWHKRKPGDLLWVREKFAVGGNGFFYANDFDGSVIVSFTPGIHMPRQASRITLELESVKLERLQDISEESARREGAPVEFCISHKVGDVGYDYQVPNSHRGGFCNLWNSLHGHQPWATWGANPEVVALRFRVHKMNIDDFIAGQRRG